jgi:hypothetical protein
MGSSIEGVVVDKKKVVKGLAVGSAIVAGAVVLFYVAVALFFVIVFSGVQWG